MTRGAGSPVASRARRFAGRFAGRRGSAQLGLVVAAAAVAGGMTLGHGIASHDGASGYDLAWLADGNRGQVVQVDPVLGRANVRLQVATAGDPLSVQQGDGQLVVTDTRTGKVTSISLATLLVGGARTEPAGTAVKVLLTGDKLYVANLARGTVQAVNPATEAGIGTPWSAGRPIVDVGVDGQHRVWVLESGDILTTLDWSAGHSTLNPIGHRTIPGAGPGSVVVGHAQGVTVVGGGGSIAQVGTGHDSDLDSPKVRGPLVAGPRSPTDLVPVAAPDHSSVVIVDSGQTTVDDVSGLGCVHPAAPTVFDGRIYVPCTGAQKVIVLDPAGNQIGAAIPTPGGTAQLIVSGSHLLVDVPGSSSATVIDGSGSSRHFPTIDPGIGVQNPASKPPAPPSDPTPPPTQPTHPPGHHDGGHGSGGSHGDAPTDGGGAPTTGGSAAGGSGPGGHAHAPAGTGGAPGSGTTAPTAPTAATASATPEPDGSVLASWTGPAAAGGYTVTLVSSGAQVGTAAAGAGSARITGLTTDWTGSLVVHAWSDAAHAHELWQAVTNTVTATPRPDPVAALTSSVSSYAGSNATLAVRWQPGAHPGSSYTVTATGSAKAITTASTAARIRVNCPAGCTGTLQVTASNESGTSDAASASYSVPAPGSSAPTQPPAQPTQPPTQPTQPAPPPASPTPTPTPEPQPTGPTPPPMASGEQVVTVSDYEPGDRSDPDPATVALDVTMPAEWASWTGGTCTLYDNAVEVQTVPCNSSGLEVDRSYAVSGTHTYKVTASNSAGSVDSASVTQRVVVVAGSPPCYNGAGVRTAAQPEQVAPCQPQ